MELAQIAIWRWLGRMYNTTFFSVVFESCHLDTNVRAIAMLH